MGALTLQHGGTKTAVYEDLGIKNARRLSAGLPTVCICKSLQIYEFILTNQNKKFSLNLKYTPFFRQTTQNHAEILPK